MVTSVLVRDNQILHYVIKDGGGKWGLFYSGTLLSHTG